MVRDFDLIRHILLTCEAAPAGAVLDPTGFDWPDKAALAEHVRLLDGKGYLSARFLLGGDEFVIVSFDWDGHDLLAQMKSDTWWASIKKTAKEKGLELTFDVVKALAAAALKGMAGG